MQASTTAQNIRAACPQAQRACRPARRPCVIAAAAREPQQAAREAPQAAPPSLLRRLQVAGAAAALSAALAFAPMAAPQEAYASVISNDTPVVDLAKVVPRDKLEPLQQQLKDLESETGWRVRMLTRFGPSDDPSVEEIRAGWTVDDKTIVVFVDPSSPNIMQFKFGRSVREVLRPQFFSELQGRYGNLYNVREQGDSAAVLSMMDSLTGCLARGGCFVVPGITQDHYFLTLAVSVAGGVIAGSAAKLEPTGFVQRRWVWVLLFAPLWGTLFICFGLGPVVSRTSDLLPLLGNVAGFSAAAALVGFSPQVARATGLTVDEP